MADLGFVETYAVGMRAVDERAEKMAFPLDTAYLQVFPQPSGSHTVLLTAPITDITNLLKELPSSHFELPHVSQMRTHTFRVPLPGSVIDQLNPAVETHHMVARIACIGDSITACGYPKYLQEMLNRAEIRTEVRNFGVAGTTAQRFADQPYWDERALEKARLWRPHFVIATFGTNDAKECNWDVASFEKDYADLCHEFLERMSPKPVVYLVVPPPVYEPEALDIQQDVVNKELPASTARVAHAAERRINAPLEEQAKRSRQPAPAELIARTVVIDAFSVMGGAELTRRSYFAPDGVHPNERGTRLLALTVLANTRRDVSRCLRNWAAAAAGTPNDPMDIF